MREACSGQPGTKPPPAFPIANWVGAFLVTQAVPLESKKCTCFLQICGPCPCTPPRSPLSALSSLWQPPAALRLLLPAGFGGNQPQGCVREGMGTDRHHHQHTHLSSLESWLKSTPALKQKYSWKDFITPYQGAISVPLSPLYGWSTDWSWHASSHPSDSFYFWLCQLFPCSKLMPHSGAIPNHRLQEKGAAGVNMWVSKCSLQTGREGNNVKGMIETEKPRNVF